jgi:hypothetical protein
MISVRPLGVTDERNGFVGRNDLVGFHGVPLVDPLLAGIGGQERPTVPRLSSSFDQTRVNRHAADGNALLRSNRPTRAGKAFAVRAISSHLLHFPATEDRLEQALP